MHKCNEKSEHLVLFFLVISVHTNINSVQSGRIYIHSETNNQGLQHELDISQCSNVPDDNIFLVRTLNTQGHCARLFEEKNCQGRSQEFMARSPYHHNIPEAWDFRNVTRSVGPCRDPCDPAVTGEIPNNPPEVRLYDGTSQEGTSTFIVVEGCTRIPEYFINRTLSIETNNHCVTLYKNPFCKYNPGFDWNSIQLHHGTPYHDNIQYHWGFSEARSISHCAHKCFDRGTVVLFDRMHYEGNWRDGTFKTNSCVNIQKYWTEKPQSIKVLNDSCVKLYVTDNCTGASHTITHSQPDLSMLPISGTVQSMQVCKEKMTPVKPYNRSEAKEKEPTRPPNIKTSTSTSVWSAEVIALIIIAPVVGGVIVAIVVFVIMRKCQPQKVDMTKLTEKEIEEFLTGLGFAVSGTREDANSELPVEVLAESRPYNEAYEIPRSEIKFESNVPLGMGEFGVVFLGNIAKHEENQTDGDVKQYPVAIKTLKPGSGVHLLRSLLREVKIMSHVGRHENIVHMIGCCTENLRDGELLVLMEFCPNGSLESYLHKYKHHLPNLVLDDMIETFFLQKFSNRYESLYKNTSKTSQKPEHANLPKNFDFRQMIKWCIEIASGMKFLAEAKVVHGDLAARNVLLTKDSVAKISDFGLSRQLYAYSEYVKKNQGPLPWRWMALESIKNMQFSTMSDVWSYGILCWEIFTLGGKPYPGMTWSLDFPSDLESGLRPEMPRYGNDKCYDLLCLCWDEKPSSRPTFDEIIEEFKGILVSY